MAILEPPAVRVVLKRAGLQVGWSGALLILTYPALVATALLPAPAAFLACAVLSYVADRWTTRKASRAKLFSTHRMPTAQRFLFRGMFAVILLLRIAPDATVAVSSLLGAVLAVQLLHALYNRLRLLADTRTACRFAWLNLVPEGLPAEWPRASVRGIWPYRNDARRTLLHADVLPVLATAAVGLGLPLTVLPVLCAAAVLLAAVVPAMLGTRLLALRGLPDEEEVFQRLLTVVEQLSPEVAIYFSSPRGSTYALNDWMGPFNQSRRPTLLIVRESYHLPGLAETHLPVVVLPRAEDVVRMRVPSLRAALYTTNVIKNNDMLRLAGIRSAFLIHGDSDKKGSANPLSRVYDEIWVTGEAGRERYARSREGFRPEQIKIVGRPQLADIEVTGPRARAGGTVSVLYAPTWEGFFEASDYSSVVTMGEQVVDHLLRMGARVIFKRHPATGTRSRAHLAAVRRIEDRVRATGNGSTVVEESGGLHAAFNQADVLITDISAVATDFLYSTKPLIVTNPSGRDDASFLEEFPSTEGAYRIGPDCDRLAQTIELALGDDPLRELRLHVRTRLVGDGTGDPMERFLDAIDLLVECNTYTPPADGLRRLVVTGEERAGGFAEDELARSRTSRAEDATAEQAAETAADVESGLRADEPEASPEAPQEEAE